ncbi:MAG: hypothetical protein H6660_03860 [Ardenticatenaceae bacterium]|nr:hypothetical protein [Ardenticatenaceae bacterium]
MADRTATPTQTGNPVPLAVNRDVYTIEFTELAAAPAAYEGYRLRLTGLYKPLPTLVCATDAHPSPATWGLVADGYLAYIDGYAHLRTLLPSGLTMTVEGQWRHWEGPVGCGKEATHQEIWYLAASEIVDPSPITRVTLTPAGNDEGVIAQLETPTPAEVISEETPIPPTATPTIEVDETAVPPTLPPISTVPSISTPPLVITITPTIMPITITVTPTADAKSETPTITPGATITGTPGINTATPTPGDDTVQQTPTATSTAGPSPTPSSTPTLIDMGDIEDQFLAVETLGLNEAHQWSVAIEANEVLTAYVAAPNADMVITLLDENGTVIDTQNNAPAGEIETFVHFIPNDGTYVLHVSSNTATATDYALMLRFNESYAFVLRGILSYGNSQEVSLPADNDDFWHFSGQAGDEISITVLPDAAGDAFLKLYDGEAEDISGFIDEGGVGEAEEYTLTLPATGFYSVRLGEFDFNPMTYTIVLVKN